MLYARDICFNRTAFALLLLIFFVSVKAQLPKRDMLVWFRSDTGVVRNLDSVVSWTSAGGSSVAAEKTTPGAPLFLASQVNGLPSIVFNGKDAGLQTSALATFPEKRGTICIVLKVNGNSFRSSVGAGNVVSTYHGNGASWQFSASARKFSFYDGKGGEGFPVSDAAVMGWSIVTLVRTADTLLDFYHNGRLLSTVAIHDNQPSVNRIKIGHNGLRVTEEDDISEVFNGEMAELLIYDKALSGKELGQLHDYLSVRYNIPLAPAPFYKRWWFYALAVFVLMLIVLLLMKTIQYRKAKRRLRELLEQQKLEQERMRIARDIHDELGTGLSKITLVAEMARAGSQGPEELRQNLTGISRTSRELIENMRDLVWLLNTDHITLGSLAARLKEYSYEYLDNFPLETDVRVDDPFPEAEVSKEVHRNILLVFKEILGNLVKHAKAGRVSVDIRTVDGFFEIAVTDDGCGFDTGVTAGGNGLRNMRERIAVLGGDIRVESEKEKGTRIRIRVALGKLK